MKNNGIVWVISIMCILLAITNLVNLASMDRQFEILTEYRESRLKTLENLTTLEGDLEVNYLLERNINYTPPLTICNDEGIYRWIKNVSDFNFSDCLQIPCECHDWGCLKMCMECG